jgi:hypothetical protein
MAHAPVCRIRYSHTLTSHVLTHTPHVTALLLLRRCCSAVHLDDFKPILASGSFPLLSAALGITGKRATNGGDSGGGDDGVSDGSGGGWREQLASLRWYLCLMERVSSHGDDDGGDGDGGEGDEVATVRREPGMAVPLFHTL